MCLGVHLSARFLVPNMLTWMIKRRLVVIAMVLWYYDYSRSSLYGKSQLRLAYFKLI